MMKFAILVCLVMISGVYGDTSIKLKYTKEIGSEEFETAGTNFVDVVSFEMKK